MLSTLSVLLSVVFLLSLFLLCIDFVTGKRANRKNEVRVSRRAMLLDMQGRKCGYTFRSSQSFNPGSLRSRKSIIRHRRDAIPGGDIEPATSI